MMLNLFATDFKHINKELVKNQIESCLAMDEPSLINFYNAMINRKDYSTWLVKSLFPVQWIIGLEDNVLPYKKLLQQCYSSDINFVSFYPGCGHMSMLETPERLTSDLKIFADYCYGLVDEYI
jgi:pimeloyl-ACP methyl ester carboxylesterase